MKTLNYRRIVLDEYTSHESVGVLVRSGGYRYLRWLGFIELEKAKGLKNAKPVKLEIRAISKTDGFGDWEQLLENQHVQGCLTPLGVYGVIQEGSPRIV